MVFVLQWRDTLGFILYDLYNSAADGYVGLVCSETGSNPGGLPSACSTKSVRGGCTRSNSDKSSSFSTAFRFFPRYFRLRLLSSCFVCAEDGSRIDGSDGVAVGCSVAFWRFNGLGLVSAAEAASSTGLHVMMWATSGKKEANVGML